jgi:serine/threonine protein kinase
MRFIVLLLAVLVYLYEPFPSANTVVVNAAAVQNVSVPYDHDVLLTYINGFKNSNIHKRDINVPSKKNKFIGKILKKTYRLEKVLGEGSFGQVYSAINLKTNKKVAVKISNGFFSWFFARKELQILKKLQKLLKGDSTT